MGSATTQALAASTTALQAAGAIDLTTARELFAAARTVGDSSQLSGALADPAAPADLRARVISQVFAGYSEQTRAVLAAAVEQRWSNAKQLVAGLEELGIRATAIAAADVDVEGELFEVSRTVAANPELELALGSRLGDSTKKGDLITAIIGNSTSEATVLIVSSLVQQPRERRVRQMLTSAMRIVASQRGRTVATVVSATELTPEQTQRLTALLSAKYGGQISLNTVVDSKVVGGLRVQVADDIIDASISSRLADLRQRLAG